MDRVPSSQHDGAVVRPIHGMHASSPRAPSQSGRVCGTTVPFAGGTFDILINRARLVTVFGICRFRVSDKSPMHAQTFVRLQWPRARLCFDTVGRECGGPTARRSPLAVRRTILYSARAYEIWGCGRAQAWPRFYSSGTGSVFSASGRGGEGALCKREPDFDRSLSGGGPGS